MHLLRCLLMVLIAGVATVAWADPETPAQTQPPAPEPAVAAAAPDQPAAAEAAEPWYTLYKGKKLGFGLDLGAPDGAGVMVQFRPWWWLRTNAGFAYNVMGAGIRGGFTVAPLRWVVAPTLSFDYGHYFSGDVNTFVSTSDPYEKALLRNAAYDFWSLQLGTEIGSPERWAFYFRGGIAHVGAGISGADFTNYVNSKLQDASNSYRTGDADFSMISPCFSLGFVVFVY